MITYIGYGALALFGLFIVGAVFGLGVWVGHGYPAARADRKLQQEYQAWYTKQIKETTQP